MFLPSWLNVVRRLFLLRYMGGVFQEYAIAELFRFAGLGPRNETWNLPSNGSLKSSEAQKYNSLCVKIRLEYSG